MTDEEKVALREKQWTMAMNGDVRMLIWLGKQYLGQKETPDFLKDELCEGFDLKVIDDIKFNGIIKIPPSHGSSIILTIKHLYKSFTLYLS